MNNQNKSHNKSHNKANNCNFTKFDICDLKYTRPSLIVYFSISDTPLANNPKAYTKGFTYEFLSWREFHKVTQKYSYTNAVFKDGYRKLDNIKSFGNLLIFDVDNNYDINKVREDLKGVKSLIVTTRSHTKEHHKFRIIIPVDYCMSKDITKELYTEILKVTAKHICNLDPDKLDNACFGMDRQYAPNENQVHRYIKGDIVPLKEIISIAKDNLSKKVTPSIKPLIHNNIKSDSSLSYRDKRAFIKDNFTHSYMIGLLEQRNLNIRNGKVTIPNNKTNAISIDAKTGLVRDFAKGISYDPVSLLFDVYHEGTLPQITDIVYEDIKGLR